VTEDIVTCILNGKLAGKVATCTYIFREHERNSTCGCHRTYVY